MAYADMISVVGGDPGLASEAQQNKDNWDYAIDSTASNKIHTDLVVAASIAAGAVGTSEIATDGVGQDEIAASAVGQGELKTTTEEVSHALSSASGVNKQLASTMYGFYYQIKTNSGYSVTYYTVDQQTGLTSYSNWVRMHNAGTAQTLYAQWRYVTASPPWKLPGVEGEDWGQFLWLVRRKSDGFVISARTCEDAPWMSECKRLGIPKDHPAAPAMRPNPFSMDQLSPGGELGQLPPGCEFVLVDLREFRIPVKPNRLARELATLQAKRPDFLRAGLPVAVVDQFEAEVAQKAQAEAAQNAAWEAELADKDAAAERIIDELGKSRTRRVRRLVHPSNVKDYPAAHVLGELKIKKASRSEGVDRQRLVIEHDQTYTMRTPEQMESVKWSIRRKAEKRKAWLRHQLYRRTKIDDLCEKLEADGKSLLQAIHESDSHQPDEDRKRPVIETSHGVNWKAIREADKTVAGSDQVPGFKDAGVRVVGR